VSGPKVKRIKSIDDLLGLDAEQEQQFTDPAPISQETSQNVIQLIPPTKIRAFRKHPFRLYDGERLDDMIASITDNGILTPVIIRRIEPDEDGYEYEMLAGHNRQNVAVIIGLELIPCIVKEYLSDEEAWIYVIETNVLQRSFKDFLPSEKAAVLAMRYSKMFSQGKRNDIIEEIKMLENPQYVRENSTCGHDVHKSKSRDNLGAEYDLNGRSVARYVRINDLIPELKARVDNTEIILVTGVALSYLSEAEQGMVEAVLSENEYKVNEKKAGLLREYAGKLDADFIAKILSGEKSKKPKGSAPPPLKIKHSVYSKYFAPDTNASEMERIIDEALALYFSQNGDIPDTA